MKLSLPGRCRCGTLVGWKSVERSLGFYSFYCMLLLPRKQFFESGSRARYAVQESGFARMRLYAAGLRAMDGADRLFARGILQYKEECMFYFMPVKVYQEEHCVARHQEEIAALGKRAMIITGRHSAKRNGSLSDVISALEHEGIAYDIFDEVEENPSVETVEKAAYLGRQQGTDFVIGIGGGSPMDASKAIGVLIRHPDYSWESLYDAEADASSVPLVEIPTTCGTGSEVTGASVLTRHDLKTKKSLPHAIFAQYALLDGAYLESAPLSVLRNTAVDAMGHMFESFVNKKATQFSRLFVREGLSVWSRTKAVLLGEKQAERKDFDHLLLASCYAGMAIAHTGTSIPHGLSYVLTYELGMAHGAAIGYFQENYLAVADEEERRELLSYAGFDSLKELHDFYKALCREPEIPSDVLERTFEEIASQPARLAVPDFPCDREVLRRITFGK